MSQLFGIKVGNEYLKERLDKNSYYCGQSAGSNGWGVAHGTEAEMQARLKHVQKKYGKRFETLANAEIVQLPSEWTESILKRDEQDQLYKESRQKRCKLESFLKDDGAIYIVASSKTLNKAARETFKRLQAQGHWVGISTAGYQMAIIR